MTFPEPVPVCIAAALAWLDAEPADDPVVDLERLRAHFTALSALSVGNARFLQCVEQFEARVLDVCERFKSRLLAAALPVPRSQHAAAAELTVALLEIAGSLQRVMAVVRDGGVRTCSDPDVYCARALRLVEEACLVAMMCGRPAPGELWRLACELVVAGDNADRNGDALAGTAAADVALQFKRLLALAALQPETLTAREVVWAHDFLGQAAVAAEFSRVPLLPLSAAFWIDQATGAPPVAMARGKPPLSDKLLYFSAYGVARALLPKLEWLRAGISPEESVGFAPDSEAFGVEGPGLPVGLTPDEALSLLGRMRERWMSPPSRTEVRRSGRYPVQVCVGLQVIRDVSGDAADAAGVVEWTVINESSGGYAIIAVSGVTGSVAAGMPLALRRDPAEAWTLCLVRWIRNDSPDRVELGLQVIASGWSAVSVGFGGGDTNAMVPALRLAPVPPLRRHPALVAPAGTCTSRAFSLVQESDHLYVAQARVLGLDMQTASVEIFQYEIDLYPV
ncbi:hypothetical protein [Aromatoleum buckelii]|uniref:Uncharacterized protein n=1 Tax=Aromatoleum buckelii TaxID=200254 RepID=A0ABX1N4H3_9RHOO|nr:hypothetical protein [Aromatoleum buckelii]MCK0512517.1 hypothetical protein [Aromatoleum buckelii]